MKKLIIFIGITIMGITNLMAQKSLPTRYEVGKYEVYLLTDNLGMGNTSILIDAPQDIIEQYAPQGTFPNALHAVLIKGDGKIWLIDTAFGGNIFDEMNAIGVALEDVDYVMLTHLHGDHTGGMMRDENIVFPNAQIMVSETEYNYWMSDEEMNKLADGSRGGFVSARDILSKYSDNLTPLTPCAIDDDIDDGVQPIAAYGHTMGHTMFMVKDGDNRLLIWGDLTHAMAIQMPHPEISVTYDTDPDMARKTRIEILEYLTRAENSGVAIMGMHIPGVSAGIVSKNSDGGYQFESL